MAKANSQTETHNILVLGGSFSGLAIAHKLLQTTLPLLRTQQPKKKYTVTLISASKIFYWTVGAPRALLGTDQHQLSESFIPIAQGFKQYPESDYSIVYGTVTQLDVEKRSVLVEGHGSVEYDSLIIAVGARSTNPLWSLHGDEKATEAAVRAMHEKVPGAKSVLIAGGGAAGVETAGEFGFNYGKKGAKGHKEITLLSGAKNLLPVLRADVGAQAQKKLEALGVEVVHGVRVEKAEQTADGKTRVGLSDGTVREVDIYLDVTGRRPYAPFVPAKLLDARGAVVVDEHLAVVGAGERVWATGDVSSLSKGGIFDVMFMTPVVQNNLEVAVGVAKRVLKTYAKSEKSTMMVPVGPGGGVGVAFDWKLPSWLVWLVKSRNMMFPRAVKNVMGTA